MNKIAIHSVPRSGSTWLGSIFDSSPNVAYRYQPLFSYGHKGQLTPTSSVDEINTFFEDILNTKDQFVLQSEAIQRGIIPTFKKDIITHICYKEVRYHHIIKNLLQKDQNIKMIGLIRNPFAVINSWLHAPKEFKKELGWKIEEEWRYAPKKNESKPEEFNGYQKWVEVTKLFLELQNEYPEQFVLIQYEDLLNKKQETVKSIFAFCGLNMSEQTIDFLEKSNKKNNADAYSVYKKKSNDDSWKKSLPTIIEKEIKKDKYFQEINTLYKWI